MPYGCEFCILRASPVRQRSAISIVDEMERSYFDHGIREMDFYDPVFCGASVYSKYVMSSTVET